MNKEIITIENLSKKFLFPGKREKSLKGILKSVFVKEDFWGLKEINLSIKEGEMIAIIGKNGAGKTLLLKIISGIIRPTNGKVIVKRRTSSIFAYGSGFYPDYTGRENIYLHGSILGIPKSVIKKKFDYIVSFSELQQFLDLKTKYYSNGMKTRLAFSVVSILNPEILIFDESLSPGDELFIKKAHEKIKELQENSVISLITAHSVELLRQFCEKGIVLDSGKLLYAGAIDNAIDFYRENVLHNKSLVKC